MSELQEKDSYGQVLKSTTLVGGAQVINILMGIVRAKFMAVLLGPSGVGLMGMYQAIITMVGTITGLGIGSSGVRQIAEAVGSNDENRIARTIYALRRTVLVLGIIGVLLAVVLCRPISRLTFGKEAYSGPIAVLGFTIFFGAVSGGQAALLQGMRRISALAAMNVIGALLGTLISIPIIFFWRLKGIVPALLTVSAMAVFTSWWYAKKIVIPKVSLKLNEWTKEARGMLSLGMVFMASSIMNNAVLYMIRVFVLRELGMFSVGLYQSATNLSTIYIGIILNAMGMDFYPRLTAVADNNETVNKMVNEQTRIGLLLAAPGLLATLTFAPFVISLFYSAEFIPAFHVLRWQILGIFLRVISWPIGFVLLAKGMGKTFFFTELTWNSVHVGLLWAGLKMFGLEGTGISFFIMYIVCTTGIFIVVHRVTGFYWSKENIRTGSLMLGIIALVFILPYILTNNKATLLSVLLLILVSIFCLKEIFNLVGKAWFRTALLKITHPF